MSTQGPGGKNPLIPPWAEEGDKVIITGGPAGTEDQEAGSDDTENHEIDNQQVQSEIPGPPPVHNGRGRLSGARRAFGDYAKSGSTSDLRKALKSYSRKSAGKGQGSSKRQASGITAGTALFGLLNGGTVTTSSGTLSLSDLTGLTTDQAIDRIADHLSPQSEDAENVRTSLNYALSEALQEVEVIDDANFTPELMAEVYNCYLTDLIFQQVVEDMGRAWFHAETARRTLQMESQLRELIKVIVDSKLEQVSGGNLSSISTKQITQVQIQTITQTINDWENFND